MVPTGLREQDKEGYRQCYVSRKGMIPTGLHEQDKEWYRQGYLSRKGMVPTGLREQERNDTDRACTHLCLGTRLQWTETVENQGLETNFLT
jgi:hypothetical protein